MSTNDLLINLSQRLGYSKKEGVCNGIAQRWLEAFFLDEEAIYEQRIRKIILEQERLPTTIQLLKERIKKRETQKYKLEPQEEELFDILAFFDGLELYQRPDKHSAFFNKPYRMSQEKIRPISLLAGSEKIRNLGGLYKLSSEPVCYNDKEMKQYLDDLSVILNDIPSRTVGIILTTHNHVISLAYTPGMGWKLMNVNDIKLPKIIQSFTPNQTDLLAKSIIKGLNGDLHSLHSTFDVSFVSTRNNQNLSSLKKKLASFKKSHIITKEMANREKVYDKFFKPVMDSGDPALVPYIEAFRTTFAMIAAKFNHPSIIPILAKHKAPLNELDKDGCSPAMDAALRGYDAVLRALAKNGVNLNETHHKTGFTLAHNAAQNGHLSVLELLAELKEYARNNSCILTESY